MYGSCCNGIRGPLKETISYFLLSFENMSMELTESWYYIFWAHNKYAWLLIGFIIVVCSAGVYRCPTRICYFPTKSVYQFAKFGRSSNAYRWMPRRRSTLARVRTGVYGLVPGETSEPSGAYEKFKLLIMSTKAAALVVIFVCHVPQRGLYWLSKNFRWKYNLSTRQVQYQISDRNVSDAVRAMRETVVLKVRVFVKIHNFVLFIADCYTWSHRKEQSRDFQLKNFENPAVAIESNCPSGLKTSRIFQYFYFESVSELAIISMGSSMLLRWLVSSIFCRSTIVLCSIRRCASSTRWRSRRWSDRWGESSGSTSADPCWPWFTWFLLHWVNFVVDF